MRDRTRGAVMIASALALLGASFGVSWVLAPETSVVARPASVEGDGTLVGVQGPAVGGNVTMLDENGSVSWTIEGGTGGSTISYQDVSMLEDGSVLATFADDGYRECGPYDPPCKRTGYRILNLTPEPRIVAEWSYPIRTRKDSEVHDAEMLPSGNVLVADMEYESVFVLNRTTGERSWTWNASEFYDAPADPTTVDWLHINDVDRIGEDRYLVSVRNENQLLVIERGRGVVEVINEDGDADVLNAQHNPHWIENGSVVVADSENDRVAELHRDESTGRWEVIWTLYRTGGVWLDWPRDADRLPNGNTLVTDSRNNRVVEVDRNGSLVASYRVRSLPYEADRVPFEESAGQPYEPGNEGAAEMTSQRVIPRELPLLTPLLAGLRSVVSLPFWLSELHLLVALVALALLLGGGYSLAGT
jgi:hypothetical protein